MILNELSSRLNQIVHESAASVMAGKTTAETLSPVFDFAIRELGCCVAHAWSVDPRGNRLVLVGQKYSEPLRVKINEVIDVQKSFTGLALETHEPTPHCAIENTSDRLFANLPLAEQFKIQSMLSLPVRNIGNPHQVTQVINFVFSHRLPIYLQDKSVIEELRKWSELIAAVLESNLRERTFRMSARVSQAIGRIDRLSPLHAYETFAKTICEALDSDFVSVYTENWNGTSLKLQGTAVAEGASSIIEEKAPEDVTSVWKSNRELLLPDRCRGNNSQSQQRPDESAIESLILVPIHDVRGRCKGVVKCVNYPRHNFASWRQRHSYDDIAIVEAMERSFAPPLDMLLESQSHDTSLQKIGHELKVPIVALRAVHERMKREYQPIADKGWFQFQYPYFEEVETFTLLMQRQLRQLHIAREGPSQVKITPQRIRLVTSVIQPAIKFMLPILKQHGMDHGQISHTGFDTCPAIDADAALLAQVVFNLLENMVKYFPRTKSPKSFQGSISCTRTASVLSIIFSDNGAGILESEQERIFEFGYRGADAVNSHVQGSGLGCWLAREIVQRHHGRLTVYSTYPFRLELQLPIPRESRFRLGELRGL